MLPGSYHKLKFLWPTDSMHLRHCGPVAFIPPCGLTVIGKPFSQACENNKQPILDGLLSLLQSPGELLEIGSGTGQHAAFFATALPHVTWQTSDLDENHATISAWVTDAAQPNLLPPLSLDVLTTDFPATTFDAVYSANTAHIMSMEAVRKMFELVGDVLSSGGVFCLYGPFRHEGVFNAPSNAAFHQQLQARDTAMGIRHLESLDEEGSRHQLSRKRLYAMPANNNMAVWQKEL